MLHMYLPAVYNSTDLDFFFTELLTAWSPISIYSDHNGSCTYISDLILGSRYM